MTTRTLCCVLLSAVCAYGTVHQVPTDYDTIQAAIDAAVDGDVVLVSPGTYAPITFAGRNIVVQSLDPNDPNTVAQTFIKVVSSSGPRGGQAGAGSAVLFQDGETEDAVLSGFTIVGGTGTASNALPEGQDFLIGGAIAIIQASPTITHNSISNPTPLPTYDTSTALLGGGIGCYESQALIAVNTIHHCASMYGGGLFCWGGATRMTSNLIVDNTALIGGGAFMIGGYLINNTLVGNQAPDAGGSLTGGNLLMFGQSSEQGAVRNNIFCNAPAGGGVMIELMNENADFFSCNNVWGNAPVDYQLQPADWESNEIVPTTLTGLCGNISEDPCFVSAPDGNYHLTPESPCINTCDPNPPYSWNRFDIDGEPRTISGFTDMGMDEFPTCVGPIARAGQDQRLEDPLPVQLDGSQTFFCDPCNPGQFLWTQIAGPPVELDDPTSVQPAFVPVLRGDYVFRLTVLAPDGLTASDEVLVRIVNHRPIAHAGPNVKQVDLPQSVQLDGSGSQEPDRDPLIYRWEQIEGPPVTLSDPNSVQPQFEPTELGTYGFRLRVSDGDLWSDPATVYIVLGNQVPVALIQGPHICIVGQVVTLNGSSSHDPDRVDALTYKWTQLDGPSVTLSHANAVSTTLTCPVPGAYRFALTVSDGLTTSSPAILDLLATELTHQQHTLDVDFSTDKYFHYPEVSGELVAYGVGSACDFTWNLQVKNLSTGVVKQYASGGIDTQPKLDGNRMVWFGGINWGQPWYHEPSNTSVVAADLDTGVQYLLRQYSMENSYSHPAISGNRVVWLEHTGLDPNPVGSGDAVHWWNTPYNICGADITDLSQPEYFTIARDVGTRDPYPCYTYATDFDDVIDISGTWVVWEAQGDIYGADISHLDDIKTFVICADPAPQFDPAICGTTVIWTDQRNDDGDLYGADIRDIANIRIVPLIREEGPQSQPAFEGHLLAYVDGERTGPIRTCCLTAGLDCLPIVPASEIFGCAPAVDRSTVVWQDQPYGQAQGLYTQVSYQVPDGPVTNVTQNTCYDAIQMAINAAQDGDEIVVSPGTYIGDLYLDKSITLRSVNPQDPNGVQQTILSGRGRALTLNGRATTCQLSGLTLTDAQVGLDCQAGAPVITDCVIAGHHGNGVLIGLAASPVLLRCHITGNQGHGLYQVVSNIASRSRGPQVLCVPMDNCLIAGNYDSGFYGALASLQNCTIVENQGPGIVANSVTCTNSIVYFNGVLNNGPQMIIDQDDIAYCIIQGGWSSPSVWDADPGFVAGGSWTSATTNADGENTNVEAQWRAGDYHLSPDSPCIDAGDPNCIAHPDQVDLDCLPRLVGDAVDLGAYEMR